MRLLDVRGCPRRHVVAGIAAVLLLLAAAYGVAAAKTTLTVYGAADLAFALKEIAAGFERTTGVEIALVLGSTGNLAHQIEHGAPADVFFAANESFIDRLAERGAVLRDSRVIYAQGRIVLATSRAAGFKLTGLRQLLDARVRRVSIANPVHAPYGKAAEEALRRAGIWDALAPKLIHAENVRHALQFLQTGAADAGVVALSIADTPEIEWVPIDPSLHHPLNQAGAVVRRSPHPEIARRFIDYVMGPQGRPVMKRFGFRMPGEL